MMTGRENGEFSPRRRIQSLDGLRALAVSCVLWGHLGRSAGSPKQFYETVTPLVPSATTGVQVFFVVSGFIITHLLCRERASTGRVELRAFYVRRAVRLLPALGVYLLFVGVITAVSDAHEPALGWLTSLTFTKNFYAPSWLTGHLWSLSVEEQFYLMWPVLFVLCGARARWWLALGLVAIAVPCRAFLLATGHEGFAHASLMTNVDYLMSGALIALALGDSKIPMLSRRAWHALFWAAVLTAVLLAIALGATDSVLVRSVLPTLGALCMGVLVFSATRIETGPVATVLQNPAVTYFGRASYSLYLWQQAFFVIDGYYGGSDSLLAVSAFPLNLVLAVACGLLSYELIELRSVALGKQLLRHYRQGSATRTIAE